MSKSLIQTTNQTTQAVAVGGIISPGSVMRRFGCNCRLSGNAIEIDGEGYYTIKAAVTVQPTAAGAVTVVLQENGVAIPAAFASGTAAAAADPVTLPIVTTVRKGCGCQGASNITAVLTAGAGNVTNVSILVEKA
ncbi:MAG: hypothetical protein IJI19_06005 [Ruminococcus sp.]|nr:hypothetical protein [Ruminococcus sp.]